MDSVAVTGFIINLNAGTGLGKSTATLGLDALLICLRNRLVGCSCKVSPYTRKALTCLIVALSLLGIVGAAFGWDYYQTSYNWGFQNYSYLGFNQAMNFTDAPHQGVPHDSSLVGYWNMNEGSGTVAHDSSVNGNNGTITGASWVDGKYGEALSFNGTTDYALTSYSSTFNFGTRTIFLELLGNI